MSETHWEPQARQKMVLSCPYDELLYGGAAGAGKSWCLLFDYIAHSYRCETKFGYPSSGVIFRRTFKEIGNLVKESKIMFKDLGWEFREKDFTWYGPGGSTLAMSYLDSYDDAIGHSGHEYDYEGFDEATLWAVPDMYDFMGSRLRSSKGLPTRQLLTTNPGGPGHVWVMKHFKIDEYPMGMVPIHSYFQKGKGLIVPPSKTDDNGNSRCEWDTLKKDELPKGIVRKTRIFIPGRLKDNMYLYDDGEYEAKLRTRPKHIQQMLLEGRWDVIEGAFFSEWDPTVHVIRPFSIPKDWKRWFAMDWGTTSPYAGLWLAEAPNGDIHVYGEIYGQGDGHNQGTRETAQEVARKILDIERLRQEYIRERYIDTAVFSNWGDQYTVGDQFARSGVAFSPVKKWKKEHSVNLLRQGLKVVNGMSRIKVHASCINLIRTLPAAPVDKNKPELYDQRAEVHAIDALIYALRRDVLDPTEVGQERTRAAIINSRRMEGYGQYGA